MISRLVDVSATPVHSFHRARRHTIRCSGDHRADFLNPYLLFDVFTEYKMSKDITFWATIENLTDQYYVDPLSLVQQPGPGRTARVGLTGKFGGNDPVSQLSMARIFGSSSTVANWGGFYAGVNTTYNFAEFRGQMTAASGAIAGRETPNMDVKALSFGIHAGYNYQFSNRMVLGIEAISRVPRSEVRKSLSQRKVLPVLSAII
jgi:hypothetical protein